MRRTLDERVAIYITKQHGEVLSVELRRKSQVVPVYTEPRSNSVAYSFTAIVTELASRCRSNRRGNVGR